MHRCRIRLAAMLGVLGFMAWGVQLPASAGPAAPGTLSILGDVLVPADTGGLPMLVPDSAAGVGYVLSSNQVAGWDRGQAVDLRTRRPVSAVTAIPALDQTTPVVVDPRRRLLIYAERLPPPVNNGVTHTPAVTNVVGLGLRGGSVRVLFRAATRFSVVERVAALSLDDTGNDLLLLASLERGASVPDVTPSVRLDRLSVDALLRGTAGARWTRPYQLPASRCATMLNRAQPTALLVVGARAYFGCGPAATQYDQTAAGSPGVVALAGVTQRAVPAIADAFYPMPGAVGDGVTVADRLTRRLVIVSTLTGGYIMRVFDTDHSRYVGAIKGDSNPAGFTTDAATGRLYFAGTGTGNGTLGRADLAALVPTQGETQADPFRGVLSAAPYPRRMTFDAAGRRLYLPRRDISRSPAAYSIAVVRDDLPRYVEPPVSDPDANALDTVERPGLTDSNRSATARAFGADYQVVGGFTNLVQNTAGDTGSTLRPGTRSLRQAYVKQASLGNDGSAALAVSAEEDRATDADRAGANAGATFVPPALCADFGSTPTVRPVVVASAQVSCDLAKQQTVAAASYTAEDGVLLTTRGGGLPVPAPVQVGRSSALVQMKRLGGSGPVAVNVTATAENVSVLGLVSFAKVSSTVAVATHGRSGTATAATPVVTVSGAEIGGKPACATPCSTDVLQATLNKALAGRAYVAFPPAMVTRSKRGAFVSVTQDPWYHAERVLDYDKADDDYAVPAMTILVYLDRSAKSRLVVDLAAVTADAAYRIYALDRFTGGPPAAAGPAGSLLPPSGLVAPPPGAPGLVGGGTPADVAAGSAPQQGLMGEVAARLRLALRSPASALPLLLIWALLGLPEYLAARRRLLLELPMLTREQDA